MTSCPGQGETLSRLGQKVRLGRLAEMEESGRGGYPLRPLSVTEMRRLLAKRWSPPGVTLPEMDSKAVTSVIRSTGGNFRLFESL
jgi:hypothetical protein